MGATRRLGGWRWSDSKDQRPRKEPRSVGRKKEGGSEPQRLQTVCHGISDLKLPSTLAATLTYKRRPHTDWARGHADCCLPSRLGPCKQAAVAPFRCLESAVPGERPRGRGLGPCETISSHSVQSGPGEAAKAKRRMARLRRASALAGTEEAV